jgi:2-oxoisovalerate dehydrogenase E1 component alpha subunit
MRARPGALRLLLQLGLSQLTRQVVSARLGNDPTRPGLGGGRSAIENPPRVENLTVDLLHPSLDHVQIGERGRGIAGHHIRLSLVADVAELMRDEDPVRRLFDSHGAMSADARRSLGLEPDTLRDLYRKMVSIRRADQEALNLQRQGELGLWGQFLGQEAVHVGATMALQPTDWIFPSYREFGMAMCRGIDPAEMLTLFRGLSHGPWDPRRYCFAPLAIPVATQVPHAVGFAMGCRLKQTDEAVLVTFGDGATSEGDWHEAMNFAGVFRSPVVFLCQNNYWAISVPFNRQTAGSIAERAPGYGFPGIRIDGNDVLAVYAATRAAADRARRGGGPYLIEAVTYRMGAHTSSDDPTRYRLDADVAPWALKDPIARYRAWLTDEGILDDAAVAAADEHAEAVAREMRGKLGRLPVPTSGDAVYGRVYQNPPEPFMREREEFEASLEPK